MSTKEEVTNEEDTRTEWQKHIGVGERLYNIAEVKGGAAEWGRRNGGK